MIPKIIHYTWFSGEEMPQVVKDCIESWKRLMPDYQYRLWDMNAIKDIDSDFLREALAARKWAQYLTSHCMGAIPQTAYIQDCIRYYDHVHFTLCPVGGHTYRRLNSSSIELTFF